MTKLAPLGAGRDNDSDNIKNSFMILKYEVVFYSRRYIAVAEMGIQPLLVSSYHYCRIYTTGTDSSK